VKAALDTNILAYAEGINGSDRRDSVLALLRNVRQDTILIPAQALGELFNVLVRKAGKSRRHARDALLSWSDAFPVVETSSQTMQVAAGLATDHRMAIWDAVILSVASQAGCRLLLSEDFQEGFTWGGVTVANPFASPKHALLKALLA
jgi:predicted nucleic acid-binding protein